MTVQQSELAAVHARLRRVERWVVVMAAAWITSVTAAVLLGPWTARAAPQPAVIRTPAIEIVDAAGHIRATLDAYNRKPGLWLVDPGGRRRAGLALGPQGAPELALMDDQGRARLLMRTGFERAAEVRLTDSAGRPRLGLWMGYTDEPAIWLFDELARPRIGMKVLAGGVGRLWLFEDPSGKVLFSAP